MFTIVRCIGMCVLCRLDTGIVYKVIVLILCQLHETFRSMIGDLVLTAHFHVRDYIYNFCVYV